MQAPALEIEIQRIRKISENVLYMYVFIYLFTEMPY